MSERVTKEQLISAIEQMYSKGKSLIIPKASGLTWHTRACYRHNATEIKQHFMDEHDKYVVMSWDKEKEQLSFTVTDEPAKGGKRIWTLAELVKEQGGKVKAEKKVKPVPSEDDEF